MEEKIHMVSCSQDYSQTASVANNDLEFLILGPLLLNAVITGVNLPWLSVFIFCDGV